MTWLAKQCHVSTIQSSKIQLWMDGKRYVESDNSTREHKLTSHRNLSAGSVLLILELLIVV